MPNAWSAKDERQSQHGRQSVMERSQSRSRADQMTSHASSNDRSDEGRTANRRTMGTGNPRAPLEERSKDELYNLAEEHNIRGRSRMNKNQLITALRRSGASTL